MKKLIIFSTLTGNTEKIANGIFSVIEGEKEIINVNDNMNINFDDYDKIIIGYWVDKGDADEKIKKIIPKIKNKKVGTFGTLGAYPDSDHAKECVKKVREALEKNGNIVEKEFICQGKVAQYLIDMFRSMTEKGKGGPHSATPEREARWAEAAKHPNEKDVENAQKVFLGF